MDKSTQCYNFQRNGCQRIQGSKIKCQDCDKQAYKKLEKQQIISHLKGEAEDATDVIGVYPLLEDETCRFIVFDFDNHEKDGEKRDFANMDDVWNKENMCFKWYRTNAKNRFEMNLVELW